MSTAPEPSARRPDAPSPAPAAPPGPGAEGPRAAPIGTPRPARSARRPLMVLAFAVLVGALATGVHFWRTAGLEETDDAQIEADVVPIAPRVGGQVEAVLVHDDQRVHAGDPILVLDDAELAARAEQADAAVATATAQAAEADANVALVDASAQGGLRTAQAGVAGAHDAVRSAAAQVTAARAAVQRAEAQARITAAEVTRTRALFAQRAVSQAQLDITQANDDGARAAVSQAQAQLLTALAAQQGATTGISQAEGRLQQSAPVDVQRAAARARSDLAHARVREAEAARALARLSLSWTRVLAPHDGVVSRLSVRAGQIVSAAQPVASLVPVDVYVVANFKETQVGRMRAGQHAEIHIDALPGRTFRGTVESVSGGTGARFSLLPPDNASGNFVKVVQRVPVRIRFAHRPNVPLQAGLSADVTIRVE